MGPDGEAEAKALASTVRMRILRACLHEPRTNKQIAAVVGINAGTCLHHVRRLADTGFLVAEPARTGARGAREIPYRATRKSWHAPVLDPARLLIDTFLEDIADVPLADVDTSRLGLKLSAADAQEFKDRIYGLLDEYAHRASDPAGAAWSVFVAVHPDPLNRSEP